MNMMCRLAMGERFDPEWPVKLLTSLWPVDQNISSLWTQWINAYIDFIMSLKKTSKTLQSLVRFSTRLAYLEGEAFIVLDNRCAIERTINNRHLCIVYNLCTYTTSLNESGKKVLGYEWLYGTKMSGRQRKAGSVNLITFFLISISEGYRVSIK